MHQFETVCRSLVPYNAISANLQPFYFYYMYKLLFGVFTPRDIATCCSAAARSARIAQCHVGVTDERLTAEYSMYAAYKSPPPHTPCDTCVREGGCVLLLYDVNCQYFVNMHDCRLKVSTWMVILYSECRLSVFTHIGLQLANLLSQTTKVSKLNFLPRTGYNFARP